MITALVYLLGLGSGAGLGWWLALNSKEQWQRLDREYEAGYDSGFEWGQTLAKRYGVAVPSPSGGEK